MPKENREKITARAAAAEVVDQVLQDGAYTNIAVNNFLRRHNLEEQERKFFTELVYGTIKAAGTVDWYLERCLTRPLSKIDRMVLAVLRISAFQILYLERIPNSAACNEAVKLTRLYSHEGSAKFVNGVLRGLLRKLDTLVFPEKKSDLAGYLSLKYSHPRWLVKRWLGQFGEEDTEKLCAFNNTPASVCLRVNTLVTNRAALMQKLQQAGADVRASLWSEDGIICDKLPALGDIMAKLHDSFYVQDESSMLVGRVVAPQPGENIIDMCSAPGGKTTHIGQLMRNQGSILAGDIHEHKIKLIGDNAARLGISIITPRLLDATVFVPELEKTADRVLVDAPCSGLGVLRRRAEARWRKKKADLKVFPPLQLQILRNAARYVKQDGLLVYSTCTIEPAENHYLIEQFLEAEPEWQYAGFLHPLDKTMVKELQLLPQKDGTDGFYICALKRKSQGE